MTIRSVALGVLAAAIIVGCAPVAAPVEPATAVPATEAPQPTEAPMESEPTSADVQSGPSTFTFVPGETVARFVVDEVLSGNPKTVIGTTSGVIGGLTVDLAAPQQATLSAVQVDLSGLETDNSFRNRAIHEAILQTDKEENRFATFNATQITGVPETVTPGTPYEIQVTGDLTIKGTTRQVTFDATVTAVSQDRIEGTASLSLPYADFGVDVPFLPPQVASVGDIVSLEIDIAATR